MSKKEEPAEKKISQLNNVAQDTNWRIYCAKEHQAAQQFNADWGFLTYNAQSKFKPRLVTWFIAGKEVPTTLDQRIEATIK